MQHVKDLKLCLPSNYRNEFNLEFLVSLLFYPYQVRRYM